MILLFLIPVKLLLGKMASPQLLNQYNMTQFTDITKAVQSGNLKLLNDSLLKHQDYFIQKVTSSRVYILYIYMITGCLFNPRKVKNFGIQKLVQEDVSFVLNVMKSLNVMN